MAHSQHVAIVQSVCFGLFAINKGTVSTAKVFYIGGVKYGDNLCMVAADCGVIDAQVIMLRSLSWLRPILSEPCSSSRSST